jgi:hypothetical protein
MSKQTNAFQKLIHHIHSKTEKTDAKVTESASLIEKNIVEPIAREIDVLIEKEVNGRIAKIAIECRDRACKDDIEWVDCLVGKYKNLDIHKVVAVSNSGFSRAAKLKAEANGIDLKTIDEALQINFGEEFRKLKLTYISHIFKLKNVTISFNPPSKKKPTPRTLVYDDGCAIGNLEELTKVCYEEGTKKKLIPYHKQNFLNTFKTRADVERQMLIEHTIPINGLYIESEGENYYITAISFTLIGIPTTQDVTAKHRNYEGALITESVFDIKEMDKIHTTWIAQFPKSKDANVFVKSKPRKMKK